MDFNHPKQPNTSWEVLDMAMEDHFGLNDLCPNYSLQTHQISSSTQMPNSSFFGTQNRNHQIEEEEEKEPEGELGAMKKMMYKIAAMQPVDIDPATIRKPKRRNVRISDDPQSVAARLRRERISERMRILQRLVPGGTKMDTSSMLDEAICYVKFLKRQIRELQSNPQSPSIGHDTTNLPVESNDKALCSTVSSSAEPPVGPVYAFGGSGANDHPMYFN